MLCESNIIMQFVCFQADAQKKIQYYHVLLNSREVKKTQNAEDENQSQIPSIELVDNQVLHKVCLRPHPPCSPVILQFSCPRDTQ